MWRRLVSAWNALLGRADQSLDPSPTTQPFPPELLTKLHRLIDDELGSRARKQRADRYQRAGLTTGAALLASVLILLLISDDLTHKQVIPTSGDIPIFWVAFGTLALTLLAYLWNVLGWLGSREGVRVAQLNVVVNWATTFFIFDVVAGGSVLLSWAVGSVSDPKTWQRDAGLGGHWRASSLLRSLRSDWRIEPDS